MLVDHAVVVWLGDKDQPFTVADRQARARRAPSGFVAAPVSHADQPNPAGRGGRVRPPTGSRGAAGRTSAYFRYSSRPETAPGRVIRGGISGTEASSPVASTSRPTCAVGAKSTYGVEAPY
ncbi:hypothetical protein AB0C34_02715 [Nocardia sp. NPDC049220]|uniref:hypothetical protein n=1 Tax=Nocardia sp. NPDC049220 TaxID=3155273 RepID=UPI00340E80E1